MVFVHYSGCLEEHKNSPEINPLLLIDSGAPSSASLDQRHCLVAVVARKSTAPFGGLLYGPTPGHLEQCCCGSSSITTPSRTPRVKWYVIYRRFVFPRFVSLFIFHSSLKGFKGIWTDRERRSRTVVQCSCGAVSEPPDQTREVCLSSQDRCVSWGGCTSVAPVFQRVLGVVWCFPGVDA